MKKLLSLLSVLTISGTSAPTTIAASKYQKSSTHLENNNYTKINNLKSKSSNLKNRKKRDFYEKEKIEFLNNNFFYKFDINYNNTFSGASFGGIIGDVYQTENKVLIEDWTKYANSFDEFAQKFPEIEFISSEAKINNSIEKNFRIKTAKLNEKQIIIEEGYTKPKGKLDFPSSYKIKIYFILSVENKKIIIKNVIYNWRDAFLSARDASLKYYGIRLVGEVDTNPLLSLTLIKIEQFKNWYESEFNVLKNKREDSNYNKITLDLEEKSFENHFKIWLTQINHDYIQDLINIEQDYKINDLKLEIENIKERINNLQKSKNCIDDIFKSFKNTPVSDVVGTAVDSYDSPAKVIFQNAKKALATSLVKGPVIAAISCFLESI